MSGRRSFIAIVLLAATLHALGIARSILPAQDGLKYISIARAFQVSPWTDVVRGNDQHPLYPALVALCEPFVASVSGRGPETWQLAGQIVAATASLAVLFPLRSLALALFGPAIANMAALGFVLLPLPMAVGHDTLADSLATLALVLCLRLGVLALRWNGRVAAVGCGLAGGIGFLAKPEALVAPAAVFAVGVCVRLLKGGLAPRRVAPVLAGLTLAFLTVVGSYTLVKGEVSEKLALRIGTRLGPSAKARKAAHWLPPGLDDPRWDFSPKEEAPLATGRGFGHVISDLFLRWSDGLCGVLAVFAVWGLARDGRIRRLLAHDGERADPTNLARRVVTTYLLLFTVVLARHESRMGYLSDRHTLGLVTLSLPWAAAGVYVCARGLGRVLSLGRTSATAGKVALLGVFVAAGVFTQLKPAHAARWGHREAGRWLQQNAVHGSAVLDTRGWAAFVSGLPSYDYWHVRQALTDSHLHYVVVGDDELNAASRRSATLRALLHVAGEPVAGFPEKRGERKVGVWVYRFEPPRSWEGLQP